MIIAKLLSIKWIDRGWLVWTIFITFTDFVSIAVSCIFNSNYPPLKEELNFYIHRDTTACMSERVIDPTQLYIVQFEYTRNRQVNVRV